MQFDGRVGTAVCTTRVEDRLGKEVPLPCRAAAVTVPAVSGATMLSRRLLVPLANTPDRPCPVRPKGSGGRVVHLLERHELST